MRPQRLRRMLSAILITRLIVAICLGIAAVVGTVLMIERFRR